MMTNNEIAAIRRNAKLEAVAEMERRMRKYYDNVKGGTHAGAVGYFIGLKADEYRKEIEDEYESEAYKSDGDKTEN